MSLQFILGAAGSGKSSLLHKEMIDRSIKEPDRNFLFIVPDQFTMQTQMELVREHPDHAIMNIDALSFGRLTHRILEEAGAENISVMDDTGKSLVLRNIAGNIAEKLPILGRNISKIGYVHEIKSMISEFMLYGISSEDIGKIRDIKGMSSALSEKLGELSVLYDAFKEKLGSDYITKEEKITLLADNIGRSDIVRGSVIAFDGFTGFTPLQYNVIRELLKRADEVKVSLLFDTREDLKDADAEQSLFHMSTDTMRRLRQTAGEADTAVLPNIIISAECDTAGMTESKPQDTAHNAVESTASDTAHNVAKYITSGRFAGNPELAHLERNLFRYPHQVYEKKPENIFINESSSVHEEIRQTCEMIRRMIRTSDLCYRDFAVVSGNLSGYANELENEFAAFGLPVYMDQARAILLNPFIEMIRSSLRIKADDFSQESVMHYLRCGMSGVLMEDADVFENFIRQYGIRGRKRYEEAFTIGTSIDAPSSRDMERINIVRETLLDELAPLIYGKNETAEDFTRSLYSFLDKNDAQTKAAAMEESAAADGDAAKAKEYSGIYRLTMDLLDQIVTLLGSEKMDIEEYTQILEAGFAEIRAGTIPQDVDRIMVGDMERTRLSGVKVLFFIGVNDGNIPADTSKGGILSDIDREKLASIGVELAPTPREQMFMQRLYLYMNMTKPSEKLFISYALMDSSGRSLRPSYLIGIMKELFPEIAIGCPEKGDVVESLESRVDISQIFAQSLRETAAGDDKETADNAALIYREMKERRGCSEIADELLNAAFYEYSASPLGVRTARSLYGQEMRGSVSRFELFASCPYAHFLRYGMSLSERIEYEFRPNDIGTVFHSVLEEFGNRLISENIRWNDVPDEHIDTLINAITDKKASEYGSNILVSSARNSGIIYRLKRMLRSTARMVRSQTACGLFVPESFEMRFAHMQDIILADGDGRKISMTGKIDRIDTCQSENDKLLFRIIDYKSGIKKLSLLDVYYGTELQLPVYIDEAVNCERQLHSGKEIVPAGMFYYHIADPIIDADGEMTEEAERDAKMKQQKMSGILCGGRDTASKMDSALETGASSLVIPAAYKVSGEPATSSQTYSNEDFQTIVSYAKRKTGELGCGIGSGDISVSPLETNKKCMCDFCDYKTVCMIDTRLPGYSKRIAGKLDNDTVIKKMR